MEKLVAIFDYLMSSDNQTQIIFGQKCVDYITSKTVADAPIAWFPTSGFLKSNNFVLFLNSVYNVQVCTMQDNIIFGSSNRESRVLLKSAFLHYVRTLRKWMKNLTKIYSAFAIARKDKCRNFFLLLLLL